MKPSVSQNNKIIAKHIVNAIGSQPGAKRHWDEAKEYFLDIFNCQDKQDSSLYFYGTIGLSNYSNQIEMKDSSLKNIPVELFIGAYQRFDQLPNTKCNCHLRLLCQ